MPCWLRARLFAASLYGLARSGGDTSVAGAYIAFTCAVLLWGTQEFGFLTGFITGPRSQPCPEGCTGWRRAAFAVEAVLYHEIALLLSGVAVVGRHLECGQPVRRIDVPDPMGDARKRKAKSVPWRSCP